MNLTKVDFHSHSTFSDGALTPQELSHLMTDIWVKIFSITDHDTIWAYVQSLDTNNVILPWMEITTHYSWKTIHILAYGLDPNSHDVNSFLQKQKLSRRERAMKITELLNDDLIKEWLAPIQLNIILWLEIEWPITRPDIANYLMSIGYVSTFQEAFDKWLWKYDIPIESWSILEVFSIVNDNKWKAIIAHPFAPYVSLKTIFPDIPDQMELLREFKKKGLHGIECFFSDMSQNTPRCIIDKLHREDWFLITWWSDFHGGNKSSVKLPGVLIPENYVAEFLDTVDSDR